MTRLKKHHLLPAIVIAGLIAAAPSDGRPLAPRGGYVPPIAQAGPDQTIYEDQTVTLNGSGSGTEPLDYWWDLGDGRGYSINNRIVTSFDYDSIGTFVATLRASDLMGGQATDHCTITILPRRHCAITAAIAAQPNTEHPELGAWRYRITVNWTCTTYRPRTNLYFESFWMLDALWSGCTCPQLGSALRWESPAGASLPDCVVDYGASLLCEGTPVLGGGGGRVIRVAPVARTCAGDPEGGATFDFYSDYPPALGAGVVTFWEEEAQAVYSVDMQGSFPVLPCAPTPAHPRSWGSIKALYR